MSESFRDDTWIAANSQMAPEKLHALGVIAYRWNTAEFVFKGLLVIVADVEFFKLWTIIHEMGDIAISAAMLEITKDNPLPTPFQGALEHGLKLYDANRINRNQLTHFIPLSLIGSDLARMKGPAWKPEPFPNSIDDLRRVAEEIGALGRYLTKLSNAISSWRYLQSPGTLPPAPQPLPEIIPLPERLWKPPLPNPQGRKGQP
jgi:hypothetical protein